MIVTGGSSGIGAATVAIFAAQGAQVVNLDLNEPPTESSKSVQYIQCNTTSVDSVNAAINSVIDKLKRIDVLVNNAGVMDNMAKVADITDEAWSKVISINVNGPFHMMRAVIPHMLANKAEAAADAPPSINRMGQPGPPRAPSKGVIVNLCSTASFHGGAAGAAYTTSKHALLGLSRNTAWMYRNQGLRCNAVMPGGTATNIYQNSKVELNPAGFEALQPFMACQFEQIGGPDGVANAIVFLASSAAENINGAELAVDNAWTAT